MSSPSLASQMRHLRESRDAYRNAAAKFAFMLTNDEQAAAELLHGAVKHEHEERRAAKASDAAAMYHRLAASSQSEVTEHG